MPSARINRSATAAAATTTVKKSVHRRRASSVTVPDTAVRLAHDFRPQKTRSNLTKRSDGRYNEPYSAIVEREDEVSVLCVQRTRHRQVLVRHMPEREWQRIVRRGEEIYPGREGESSLHVVAAPELSTLPRHFQFDPAVAGGVSNRPNTPLQPPPPPARAAAANATATTRATAAAATVEPAVFDYFVAPESRVTHLNGRSKSSAFTNLRLQMHLSHKSELQRVAREDCRAMLSVERRNIFMRQYQRDMQCRMSGVSLYTVGKELPEQFVQTFFMLVENAQTLRRYQERLDAMSHGTAAAQQQRRRAQQQQQQQQRNGGRYLFTIDQASTNSGERLPFAGQAPADGYVVVTVGPTAEAFNAAWRPTSASGRFAWMDELGGDDVPFVPHTYGTAAYLPLLPTPVLTNEEEEVVQKANRVRGSSPLLVNFAERRAAKRLSGLSSNGTSPLGLSRSGASSPFCSTQGTAMAMEDAANLCTRTPSPLPVSSDEGEEASAAEPATPLPLPRRPKTAVAT